MANPTAKILADSISPQGKRITTFEITLPKCLLAEYNTHALIARNFSSARAIPVNRNIEIESFYPIRWGKNQPGMVALDEEIEAIDSASAIWQQAIESCKEFSKQLSDLKLHKQWSNRLNDWHTMAKGVTTATEFENLFWLRDADDAQPEIADLVRQMKKLREENEPALLYPDEWHLPYITTYRGEYCEWLDYLDPLSGESLSLETARTVSMARCAAVSYRTEDIGVEKAQDIYTKLFSGQKVHASPAMHQATPMEDLPTITKKLEYMFGTEGVTHLDRYGALWSGNLQGWIQYRQLLPNHYKRG